MDSPIRRAVVATCLLTCLPIVRAQPVEKVAGGFEFVEGPAWDPTKNRLLFSDIRRNRILALGADDRITDYLQPSERANGLVFDARGNLYACLGGARQVIRIAADGTRAVLASAFDGKKLNSPNDLALDDHGGLYFTDPRYGDADDLEQDVMAVYYIAADGELRRVVDDLERPNGIAMARDGSGLYVAEPNLRELHYYPILAPGRVGAGRVLFRGDPELDGGGPDGLAIDAHGDVYTTYAGLVVLNAAGTLQRRIPIPERPANCAFGGPDHDTLYVTAQTGLYRVRPGRRGAPLRGVETAATPPELPRFESVVVDAAVGIGYGLAVEDMDGDGRRDIVLADKDVLVWYQNPDWRKRVVAQKLTARDHVCLAVRDLDGDGKAELAAGAGWNPADTVASGSVHYLVPGADRASPWQPIALPHEPTTHRMRWIRRHDGWSLAVLPLHGRGNRSGQGAGVRFVEYRRPAEATGSWPTHVIDDSLHVAHNLDPVSWDDDAPDELLVAAREGLFLFDPRGDSWQRTALTGPVVGQTDFAGASEVRAGRLAGGTRFVAAVEPFHGHQVTVYTAPETGSPRTFWVRRVLDDTLQQAHAMACGDLLGLGSDQLVAGWRNRDAEGKVGIRIYVPLDAGGQRWHRAVIDDDTMACEDLRLADVDGDGRLDVVAAGRATHNVKVWFNRSR